MCRKNIDAFIFLRRPWSKSNFYYMYRMLAKAAKMVFALFFLVLPDFRGGGVDWGVFILTLCVPRYG